MFTRTPIAHAARTTVAVSAILLTLSCILLAGDRDYSQGPLTGNDFQQTPPNPPPVSNGIPLAAETSVGTKYDHEGTATTANGTTTYTPDSVNVDAYIDPQKSWNSDPNNKDLLNHEQTHFDLEEQIAREAQAEINKQIADGKLKGTGKTPDEAKKDFEDKVDKIIQKIADERQQKLDQKTKHGTDPAEQKKAEEAIRKALQKPNTDPQSKKLSQAKTHVSSLNFDLASNKLTIAGDSITGINNANGSVKPGSDPSLGAPISFPDFFFAGTNSDGLSFFAAGADADTLTIGAPTSPDFETTLPYLVYDPSLNLLYGLGRGYEFHTETLPDSFLDDLRLALGTGPLALFGVNITPESNLFDATEGFTQNASMSASNEEGARVLPVPLPAPLTMGLALLSTMGISVTLRRQHHGYVHRLAQR